MSQHEQYTVPPGFSVSGGSGGTTKLAPVLVPGPIVISSAELLALHVTRKVLIPAQGPGTLVLPTSLSLHSHMTGQTPYSGGGSVLQFGWGDDPGTAYFVGESDTLVTSADDRLLAGVGGTGVEFAAADAINQPFTVKGLVQLTGGTGTLDVIVSYIVVQP
jgi:hypothetical protein